MFTLQKQFILTKNIMLNLGTQAGPNISMNAQNKKVAFFNNAILCLNVLNRINWVIGLYHTDNTFVGKSKYHIGFVTDYEMSLSKRLSLMGDLISGDHKKSQTTLGALQTKSNRVQLCAAALLDYPHGQMNHGVVFELHYFGWDINTHH